SHLARSGAERRGDRRAPCVWRGSLKAERGWRSGLAKLLDELPVGDEPLAEQDRQERGDDRLPADVVAEDLASIGAARRRAQRADEVARGEALGGAGVAPLCGQRD